MIFIWYSTSSQNKSRTCIVYDQTGFMVIPHLNIIRIKILEASFLYVTFLDGCDTMPNYFFIFFLDFIIAFTI